MAEGYGRGDAVLLSRRKPMRFKTHSSTDPMNVMITRDRQLRVLYATKHITLTTLHSFYSISRTIRVAEAALKRRAVSTSRPPDRSMESIKRSYDELVAALTANLQADNAR